MNGSDDDDPAIIDWGPDAATSVDQMPTVIEARPEPLVETNPHDTLEYNAGREAGFSEGVEALVKSLARELAKAGFPDAEARRVCARVRDAALRTG